VTVDLGGIGVAPYVPQPSLRLSAESLDFGEVVVGGRASRDLTVSNDGDAALIIEGIRSESAEFVVTTIGDQAFDSSRFEFRRTDVSHSILVAEALLDGETLGAGSEVGVFTPDGLCAGAAVVDRAGDRIGLAAWGDDADTEVIDGFRAGEGFAFRYWDAVSGREITVGFEVVQGSDTFTAHGVTVVTLSGQTGIARLAAGASLVVPVTFIPGAPEDYASGLVITSNDTAAGEVRVALHGSGVVRGAGRPTISVEPDELDFGETLVGDLSTREVTIRNSGDTTLVVSEITTGEGSFTVDFVGGAEYESSPFEYNRTEVSHSVLVESALLDGESLRAGSEIALYTSGGICAGVGVVARTGDRLGMAAWGDDQNSGEIDGFRDGEEFSFRYWDADSRREVSAIPEYVRGPETFTANSVSIVRLTGEIADEGRVAVGDSISVTVMFGPLLEAAYQTELFISSNDAETPVSRVALQGSGYVIHPPAPIIRLDIDALEFGDVEIGDNAVRDLTIWNDGNAPLILESMDTDDRSFRVDFEAGNVVEESPFRYSRTNESHSIMIADVTLNGSPLSVNSEVGVFTPQDLCAGAEPVTEAGERMGVAVWADDPTTMDVDGFREGEDFVFRLWDADTRREILAAVDFVQGPDTFLPEGVSIVQLSASFEEIQIAEGESYTTQVIFAPAEERDYQARLFIRSNDAESPEVEIALTGTGIRLNHAPRVSNPIDRYEAPEDCGVRVVANLDEVFEDPDGDALTYYVEGVAELNLSIDEDNNLTINPVEEYFGETNVILVAEDDVRRQAGFAGSSNREFSFSPLRANQTGDSQNARHLRSISAEATPSRDLAAGHIFTLAVLSVNDLPNITNPPNPVINADLNEGSLYRVVFEADDRDHVDSLLVWSVIDAPEGYSLQENEDGTWTFSWTPPFGSARVPPYTPIVRVTDPEDGTDQVQLNLTVHHVSVPPAVVSPILPMTIDEDPVAAIEIADLDTVFFDANGDAMQFGVQGRAELGLSIGAGNILTMRPALNFNSARGEIVIVTATDGEEETGFAFRVTIRPINDAPGAFDLVAPVDGMVIDSTRYNIAFRWQRAANVDGDQINYVVNLRVRYEQLDTTLRRGPVVADSMVLNLADILVGLGLSHHRRSFDVGITWSVSASDAEFTVVSASQRQLTVHSPVSVGDEGLISPLTLTLSPAYPNPLNSSCVIGFEVPIRSAVRLVVCDQRGQEVSSLVNEILIAGKYSVTWNASSLPTGIYLARLETTNSQIVQKLVLIK